MKKPTALQRRQPDLPSATLVANPQEVPRTGMPITPGEIITHLLVREGGRLEAVALLAETLAELGISGEEIAHWQKQPGICHDCNETGDRVHAEWTRKAATFPTSPIEMWATYFKADVP